LENIMRKILVASAAAATIAFATLAAPTTADARCRGCAVGVGIGAGLLGAAIIGSAVANSQPRYYEPAPVYGRAPVYYDDEPVCRLTHRRVWVEGVGYRTRRVEVCD
jgi:hypothetical protein